MIPPLFHPTHRGALDLIETTTDCGTQVAENADEDGTATGNTTSTSAPANYVEALLIFCLAAKPGAF